MTNLTEKAKEIREGNSSPSPQLIKSIDKKIVKWVKEGEIAYENKTIIKKIIELYNEEEKAKLQGFLLAIDEVEKMVEDYYIEYTRQSKKEHKTDVFNELPELEQGSISILSLFNTRFKKEISSAREGKKE